MIRAFQWDLARQTERLGWLIAQLPRYADWGYEEVYLHLEDAVEYPGVPGVGRRDAYTYREFERLAAAAGRAGLRLVPIVNLLGHTQYLLKVPALRDLNELREADGSPCAEGQVCPLHPGTLEVAARLLRDMAPFCTAGKVHVGLDESFHLGRHPRSRAEIARHGLAAHFAGYVNRLHGVASAQGLRLGYWADLLHHLPDAIPRLPAGTIAYDWYYHPFRRHPRVELFNFAASDLAPALRRQGIEYWGCPMNGAFRHEPLPVFSERLANIRSWWDRCRRTNAAGMLVTSWEPGRLAAELPEVVDAAAADLWLRSGKTGTGAMLAHGFARVFGGRGAVRSARLVLAADRAAYAGYARWEINRRWDAAAWAGGSPRDGELRLCRRLASQARGLAPPLAASLAFRLCLAERDAFVRRSVQAVFRLRRRLRRAGAAAVREDPAWTALATDAAAFSRALAAGRSAAQRMWRRTRASRPNGPNEQLVAEDARRLKAWRKWLGRARRQPALLLEGTPLCGAWQLQFLVHNVAPALQKVLVEQRGSDGRWRELASRFTVEFRAAAARRRADIRRRFVVALDSPDAVLRLAVRGVGRVKISAVCVTDGVTFLLPPGAPRARARPLGRAAPRSGFPPLDLNRNADELPLGRARPAPGGSRPKAPL